MVAATMAAVATPLAAQEHGEGEQLTAGMLRPFADLRGDSTDADWQSEAIASRRAVENIWKRNGWDTESDRFARDVASEIAAIPPWDPLTRMNTLSRRVTQRYGLSGEQARNFNKALFREVGGLLIKNAPLILRQSQDALGVRRQAQPFTAEQVAKWSKDLDPIMKDIYAVADRLSTELEPMLSDQAQSLFREDRASFEKRRKHMNTMAERWAKGEWRPEDWGLDDDPIQSGRAPIAAGEASDHEPRAIENGTPVRKPMAKPDAVRAKSPAVPRCVPHDHMSWIGCVVELSVRYRLDAGQMSTAESIYQELFNRAEAYVVGNREALAGVAEAQRPTHPDLAPVRDLHGELLERLHAIPTSSQREQVNP